MLTDSDFLSVIEKTPLVAIDLVITRSDGAILLGMRTNQPAKGSWCVPGGRVRKGESLEDTFQRLTKEELGATYPLGMAKLLGAFTHLYDTNFCDEPGVSTHYVVLAYELRVELQISALPKLQHSEYQYWLPHEAASSNLVLPNMLRYFLFDQSNSDSTWTIQYEILNTRRDSFNQLLWQVPIISLTAQAFLFSIIFGKDIRHEYQFAAALLAFLTAFVSICLLVKHRQSEEAAAKMATKMEEKYGLPQINAQKTKQEQGSLPAYIRQSSYRLWIHLLLAFGLTALGVAFINLLFSVLN